MLKLFTSRLILIPLQLNDLKLYLDDQPSLERKLGLNHSEDKLWEVLYETFSCAYAYLLNLKNCEAVNLWRTIWLIVLREENRIIGGVHFHEEPNENFEVEIGCFLWENYRSKGYGTEAAKKAIEFVFKNTEVKAVIGFIFKSNPTYFVSQRGCEKAGMVKLRETDEGFYYRISKD